MSLVIRLREPGKPTKGEYHYKIVVDERQSKKDGRFVEELGFWNPSKKPKKLRFDLEKYKEWMDKGAIPTETIKNLAKKASKGFFQEEQGESQKDNKQPEQKKQQEEQEEEKNKQPEYSSKEENPETQNGAESEEKTE